MSSIDDTTIRLAKALGKTPEEVKQQREQHCKSIDDAAEKISDAKAMQRYEAARDEMLDTAPAHWQMSQKCLAAKLPDQARAHMSRVLDLNPNYARAQEIRKALAALNGS